MLSRFSRLSRLVGFFILLSSLLLPGVASADESSAMPSDVASTNAVSGALTFPELSKDYQVEAIGGWAQVSYPRGTEERVRPALLELAEFRETIRKELGQDVLTNVRIRIARSPEDMASLAPTAYPPQSYATAVSYTGQKMVLVSLRAPRTHEGTNVAETVRHELTHVAVDDAFGVRRVPIWFNEGLAIHYSGEGSLMRRQTLLDAAAMNRLIAFSAIDPHFAESSDNVSLAYAESGDFIRFLLKDGDRFRSLIERTRQQQTPGSATFEKNLSDAYGSDLRTLDFQWQKEIEKIANWMPGVVTGSALWIAGSFALMIGYVRRKQKDKHVRNRWEAEEIEITERIARQTEAFSADAETFSVHIPELPRVEHEGDWHTLH
jgi:Peptidase MA superfamily